MTTDANSKADNGLPFQYPIQLDARHTVMLIERMFGHGVAQQLEQVPADGEVEEEGVEFFLQSPLFSGDMRIRLKPDGTWCAFQVLTIGSPP
jgi:hypothetical protein